MSKNAAVALREIAAVVILQIKQENPRSRPLISACMSMGSSRARQLQVPAAGIHWLKDELAKEINWSPVLW